MKMKNKKYAHKLYELIYEDEYEWTYEGDWAFHNRTLEQKLFNTLSDEAQKIYAMCHAKSYAQSVLNWSVKKFFKSYDDQYNNLEELQKDYFKYKSKFKNIK